MEKNIFHEHIESVIGINISKAQAIEFLAGYHKATIQDIKHHRPLLGNSSIVSIRFDKACNQGYNCISMKYLLADGRRAQKSAIGYYTGDRQIWAA